MKKQIDILTISQQKKIVENIVKIQSIEGIKVSENLQKSMLGILDGTQDAKVLIRNCINRYVSL